MNTFDSREEAFERRFAVEEEINFKARARRNKRIGLWAAQLLGKDGASADVYASELSDTMKLENKAHIFVALQNEYQIFKVHWGGYSGYDRWFAEPLSNAHLAIIDTYYALEPGFRALLVQQKSFTQFYAAVRKLALLPEEERRRQLHALALASSKLSTSAIDRQ